MPRIVQRLESAFVVGDHAHRHLTPADRTVAVIDNEETESKVTLCGKVFSISSADLDTVTFKQRSVNTTLCKECKEIICVTKGITIIENAKSPAEEALLKIKELVTTKALDGWASAHLDEIMDCLPPEYRDQNDTKQTRHNAS